MDKVFKIFYRTFYVAIIVIVGLLLIALFPIKGNYQIKIVQSGSMEPDIKTGSVVIIKPSSVYKVGDVVTFGKDTKKDIPTTHRIVKSRVVEGVLMFTTKGDANEDPDTNEIRLSDIHGKVLLDVPFFGYIIDLARKPLGFAILIILPALIVIYDEGAKIFREIQKMRKPKLAVNQENVGGPANSSGQEK
ncbi:signal peptidase I [Candidatus Nomurabacteria bacterium RIFCSPLOWO2_01_FULL_37_49]|nr:MAG: signal peptidase I [Candidatus Nomurabacteria bacterium RIFCSPLOWO2_01_FULL_37_49]